MSDLLNSTLGAVGQAGEALDKLTGGRALRGTLAGKPRELMSVVPFSDSLGLTNEKDKTTGRDLTDAYSLTNKGSNSFGSHAAAFAADMIASPLSLASGVGAFRATPTLTKGLTQGAKAVTGLDILDHVGVGAKKLSLFLGDEAGALPINDSLLKHLPWADRADISDEVRNAAAWAGPQYPGGRDKLLESIKGHHRGWNPEELIDHPSVDKIASEIPEGTRFLGQGLEAIAFRSPKGHVIRMSPEARPWVNDTAGRADIPEILQPFRSIQVPGNAHSGAQPWVVEHLPMVHPIEVGESQSKQANDILRRLIGERHPDANALKDQVDQTIRNLDKSSVGVSHDLRRTVKNNHPNLNPWDFHGANVALTPEGRAVGFDGGMVKSQTGGQPITRHSPIQPTPDLLAKALRLGGMDVVRESIERGIAAGSRGQGVSSFGRDYSDLGEIAANQKFLRDFIASNGNSTVPAPTTLRGVRGFALATQAPDYRQYFPGNDTA